MCINFSTRTVELRSSKRRKILHFSFSSFISFSFFLFSFLLSSLFFLSSFTNSFCLFPFYFCFFLSLFSFLFTFLFFSSYQRILFFLLFYFLFLISFFSFSHFLFFFSLFGAYLTGWSREEAFSPFTHVTCVVHNFPPYFLIALFHFFIASSFMWIIVSHTFKCTTWLFPCVTLLGCHVASP